LVVISWFLRRYAFLYNGSILHKIQ
jgi:hypothetical protein